MSAETLERLRQALEAHIADESGQIVGAWLVLAETQTLEDVEAGEASYWAESQGSVFTLMGLAKCWMDRSARPHWDEEEDW